MNIGPVQLLIIAVIILVLFGRGRISEMMGDFGKGVKSFRKGINEDDTPAAPPARIDAAKNGNGQADSAQAKTPDNSASN
ncbi:twin-arginine translocase TatA/TatE family subunit [Altererythrobacter sp. CC-YST694]|uniref:twin-arginine translocase TatA/TatE family subunit n=1 Tax=Altererythrobacter sp. CC-YST694 TaxID=2755038 RepID=UPI001D028F1B|nr:twin-arginine translocase TatA/TatE family subunit [Altererythrobacter sp. CC-YST694]MCB5426253.1 twin-arginine translocase TatA/TatE family subunit [Altererythrobacter sp. CC-YST694]